MPPSELTQLGGLLLTTLRVEQPDTPACAVRVELGDRVLVYSGDTAWSDAQVELSDGADLFVAEAYFFEREVPFHLSYSTLRANRDRLNCRRIVLVHVSPDMLARQHRAEFECARDGMVLSL